MTATKKTAWSSFVLAALMAVTVSAQTARTLPPPPDVAAPPADAQKTSSGVATKVLKPGTGRTNPTRNDQVIVHYTGWKTDGTMFDSSVARSEPALFPVNRVIPGFTETLMMMVEGEKRRTWIPEALAYRGQREPKGMLVFDIELIKIQPGR